jgi:two-component system nitrate/nitrite response regulator NarL
MAQSALDPEKSTDGDPEGHHWESSKAGKVQRVVKITQHSQKATRVVIVDRDSMGSDLLAVALSRDERFKGAAIEPSDLMRTLGSTEVDLVVIAVDVNSHSGGGFDLANSVCRTHSNIHVVMLLNQITHELVINAFRSGARGVFSRQLSMNEFLDCIRHVAKGFIWAGRHETSALLEAFKSIPAPNVRLSSDSPELTARELQVVQCAAKGKTNKTIASELRLSEHTVKNYLFRAFEKLGVSNRVELLFYLTTRSRTFTGAKDECLDADFSNE